MSSTEFTRASRTIALCAAANFINAADRVIMPIAIIQMTDEFKWNLHGQGWVLSAFAIGYMSSMVMSNFYEGTTNLGLLNNNSINDFLFIIYFYFKLFTIMCKLKF